MEIIRSLFLRSKTKVSYDEKYVVVREDIVMSFIKGRKVSEIRSFTELCNGEVRIILISFAGTSRCLRLDGGTFEFDSLQRLVGKEITGISEEELGEAELITLRSNDGEIFSMLLHGGCLEVRIEN